MKNYTITVFAHRPIGPQSSNCLQFPPNHEEFPLVLEAIKTEQLKERIANIRQLSITNPTEAQSEKGELPIILFSGEFNHFAKAGLIKLSGLICLDFDGIPTNEMASVRQQLISDPYTTAVFVSPRGSGFKVIVQLDNNISEDTHKRYFEALRAHFNSPYWDNSGSDISRACYMSSDPDLYYNPNASIWQVLAPATAAKPVVPPSGLGRTNPLYLTTGDYNKIIRYLEGGWKKFNKYPMTSGHRHYSSFGRAKELFEFGLDMTDVTNYFVQYLSIDFDAAEANRQIIQAYEYTIANGTFATKTVPPMRP